jgi:hypothetical protein
MIKQNIGTSESISSSFTPHSCPAVQMNCSERRNLSLRAIRRTEPVTRLAQQHQVSRKFVYQQLGKAASAIDRAFEPDEQKDQKVLFYLPVTRDWIHQFVLSLILICHSSFRGVLDILSAVFDYHDMSIGTVHNIVQQAMVSSRSLNDSQDLSGIRIGDHDEIYQANRPVLVGMDHRSTYCYLLSVEDSCDETTWGVHLLDLSDHGLDLERTIADGGNALRAGQRAAWGDAVPCDADVFHAQMKLTQLVVFLQRRAYKCINARQYLKAKMERAKKKSKGHRLSGRLALARQREADAVDLADQVGILADWMDNDILSVAGPNRQDRQKLYDFVVEQLHHIEPRCPHRIRPVRKMLENNRDHLLGFAGILDDRLVDVAEHFNVELYLVHKICELQGRDKTLPAYWQLREQFQHTLGKLYYSIETAVIEAMSDIPRASSLVENLNSRLRNYFFLRRHISNDYLDLLRFFFNHHRYARSDRPERVGKSPAELLSGNSHGHWLELLGFERFLRN